MVQSGIFTVSKDVRHHVSLDTSPTVESCPTTTLTSSSESYRTLPFLSHHFLEDIEVV